MPLRPASWPLLRGAVCAYADASTAGRLNGAAGEACPLGEALDAGLLAGEVLRRPELAEAARADALAPLTVGVAVALGCGSSA